MESELPIPAGSVAVVIPTAMVGTLVFVDANGNITGTLTKTGIETLKLPLPVNNLGPLL